MGLGLCNARHFLGLLNHELNKKKRREFIVLPIWDYVFWVPICDFGFLKVFFRLKGTVLLFMSVCSFQLLAEFWGVDPFRDGPFGISVIEGQIGFLLM